MSTVAKFHCENCQNDFYMYKQFSPNDKLYISCPYCALNLPSECVEEFKQAFYAVENLNTHITGCLNDDTEKILTVSFEETYVEPHKYVLPNQLND